MRTLVFGDIHGGLKGLTQLLKSIDINANDQLIFLGDYVDGWSESAHVIHQLIALSKTNSCVFVKGNHDVWCEDWLRTGEANPIWLLHGGKETLDSYTGFNAIQKKAHLHFFEDMPLFHIDDELRLFVHAGFTSMHGVTHEYESRNFYFDRTLWEMALTMDKGITTNSKLYPKRLTHYKEIYIGHTPTFHYGESLPMNAVNVWNMDTGAAFTGRLSAMNIETKEIFQSDPLKDLYPNEMGRNK